MFEVVVNLYTFILNKNKINIVSTQQDSFVPLQMKLTSDYNNIDNIVKDLLGTHLSCKISMLKPLLFNIETDNTLVNINYSVMVPLDTKIIRAYYINSDFAFSNNLTARKAILYV